jgi:hypothetical protein
MVEVKVDASKIKGEEKDITGQLAAFLKEKSGGEVSKAIKDLPKTLPK